MHIIVHILLHLLILSVSFEVFLLLSHLHLDEHDVFCFGSSLMTMDTLWQCVLSYDSYSIDTLSNICLLFSFESSSLKVYDYPS